MSAQLQTTRTYRNECLIVERIVRDLLDAGFKVLIVDEEDEWAAVDSPQEAIDWASYDYEGKRAWNLDEFWIIPMRDGKHAGSVWLITGNGDEGRTLVTDYSMSLDPFLSPILDFAEAL